MTATSNKILADEPGDIEALLPWYAAGTLNARDVSRVDEALRRDPALATQYAVIKEEYAATIELNENLGAPSARAMQKLFAAIDAEPARQPSAPNLSARMSAFFASLSPRTLAWSASLGAVALLLQAGVIGAVLMSHQPASFQTASLSMNEPATRALGPEAPPRALVRFTPEARVSDVTALLDTYQASIIDSRGGLFRVQFGNRPVDKSEAAGLVGKLQSEKIISLAVATQ